MRICSSTLSTTRILWRWSTNSLSCNQGLTLSKIGWIMLWRNYSMHLKHISTLKESISRRCMIYVGLLLSCLCSNQAHPAQLKRWTLSTKKRWTTNSSRLNPWKHADIQSLRTPPIKLNHHPWNCLSYRQTTPDKSPNTHTVPPNTLSSQSLP